MCSDSQTRLILAHVRQQHTTVGVTDHVEPLMAGDPHGGVHLDRLARRQPDRLQAERIGTGPAADRREQLIGGERAAVLELQRDRTAPALRCARRWP